MKKIVLCLNKGVFYGYKAIKFTGTVILVAIFLIITAGIISRYVINKPFSFTEELATFLMVWLCYISAALTTVRKKHIVADFFVSKASPKFQKAVGMLGKLLMIVFFIVLAISVLELIPTLVWRSGVLDIHRKWYYLPVWTMSIFMAYAVVVDIINDFVPGYDIMKIENEKQKQLDSAQETAETEAMQANMERFIKEAGIDIGAKEKEGGC